MTEDGVVGAVLPAVELCWARYRRGEAGRRVREKLLLLSGRPKTGELLLSEACGVFRSSSGIASPDSLTLLRERVRFGRPGNTSSTGFRGVRVRLGEP